MQCNGIFSPVVKYMETIKCIYFERSRCGVPKRDYAPYEIHTYSVIDERKIDRITPSREKNSPWTQASSAAVYPHLF